jgi:hypothetical protein
VARNPNPFDCTVPLNHCREATSPPEGAHFHTAFKGTDGAIGGEHHRAAGAASAAIARELCKESKEGWIVYSAIAALASERSTDEPERRQTGDFIRHESAVDETHRHIAASATGTAIAALNIVIIDSATLATRSAITTPADDWRTKAIGIRSILAEATNDRQDAVRAVDLAARLPRTAGTAGLTGTTIRPDAPAEAK